MTEEKQEVLNKYYKIIKEGKKSFNYYIKKEYLLMGNKQAQEDQRMGIMDIHNSVLEEFRAKRLGTISLNTMSKWIQLKEGTVKTGEIQPLKNDDMYIVIGDSANSKIDDIIGMPSNHKDKVIRDNNIDKIKLSANGLLRKERSDKGKARIKKVIDGFTTL